MTESQLSVVSEDEGVAGSAGSGLFTGERQASAGVGVAERGGELEISVDLVVEDGGEVVVEARFHGGVDFAGGPVGFELFGFYGSVEGEAEFGSDVAGGKGVLESGGKGRKLGNVGENDENDLKKVPKGAFWLTRAVLMPKKEMLCTKMS